MRKQREKLWKRKIKIEYDWQRQKSVRERTIKKKKIWQGWLIRRKWTEIKNTRNSF